MAHTLLDDPRAIIAPTRSLCESGHFRALVLHCKQEGRGFAVSGHKSAKEPLSWRATRYWIAACGATCMPQVPAGCPRKCCGMGRAKRGYRLNRARASASNRRLARDASQLIVRSRIALARRGSLWALATLLAVLASARLLRRYGRLNFIEFSCFLGESGLQEALFAELAAGAAGVRAYGVPTRRGAACKYWRTPGRRKMDQCGNLAD